MNNYVISPEFADPGGYEAVTEYYGDGWYPKWTHVNYTADQNLPKQPYRGITEFDEIFMVGDSVAAVVQADLWYFEPKANKERRLEEQQLERERKKEERKEKETTDKEIIERVKVKAKRVERPARKLKDHNPLNH